MASGYSRGNTCGLLQVRMMLALCFRFIFFCFKPGNAEADQPERNAKNESGKQNQTNERPSIFLSNDIWQKVALHMPTKDWVRASGTCKAMFKVELSSIDLESSSADVVVWAAKHSGKMTSVKVRLDVWNHRKSMDVLAGVDLDEWDFRQVHTMCVSLDARESGNTLYSRCAKLLFVPADDPDKWMWLSKMLTSACNAKRMYLKGEAMGGPAVNTSGVPPLVHLTHLGVSTLISPYMSNSIQHLPTLQHLTISKGPGLKDMQPLHPLDLTGCKVLQVVTLENVLPGELSVSSKVELRLIWQDSPALLESWPGICDRCTSLEVKSNDIHMGAAPTLRQQLNGMFTLPCLMLRVLHLECGWVGYVGAPLVLHLLSLELLMLDTNCTHLMLGKATCPREVCLFNIYTLELHLGDVAAFVAGIRFLAFTRAEVFAFSTRLLLENFSDPEVWQKTSGPNPKFHKISRR